MKKPVLTLIALLMTSIAAHAQTEIKYANEEGCSVIAEKRLNGSVFWVQDKKQQAVIGVTNDLKEASFAYCSPEVVNIDAVQEKSTTDIYISCPGHKNDHAKTRGRAVITFDGNQLSSLVINGEVKGLFSWKQDTLIICENLKPVAN